LAKAVRVLVLAGGDKSSRSAGSGCGFRRGDEMVQKIVEGWTDYDAVIATPDMMKSAGRWAKYSALAD